MPDGQQQPHVLGHQGAVPRRQHGQGGVDVWRDVGNGIVKSCVFGVTVTFVALYQGFEAQPTPEGVSKATTRTVVVASLLVLALDFVLTALMFSI